MSTKYNIILADPPWKYRDKSLSHGGGAECHYPTMDIKEICELSVEKIADDNCVLFLWVTFPMLKEGLKVIKSWGFEYKTCAFVWVKANKREIIKQGKLFNGIDDFMGMGRWTRSNAEVCLLGIKGKPKRISTKVRQIIYSPIRKHSQKPEEVFNRIIQLIGKLPRIELFAREKREGWDAWGNEIG